MSQNKDKLLTQRSRGVGEGFGPEAAKEILPPSAYKPLSHLRKKPLTNECPSIPLPPFCIPTWLIRDINEANGEGEVHIV